MFDWNRLWLLFRNMRFYLWRWVSKDWGNLRWRKYIRHWWLYLSHWTPRMVMHFRFSFNLHPDLWRFYENWIWNLWWPKLSSKLSRLQTWFCINRGCLFRGLRKRNRYRRWNLWWRIKKWQLRMFIGLLVSIKRVYLRRRNILRFKLWRWNMIRKWVMW